MKVLLAASEVAPIIKLGGLGDVIGSLPKELEKLGVDIDVIAPYFSFAKTENLKIYKSMEIDVPYAGKTEIVGVYKTKLPDSTVDVFLLKNKTYFTAHNSTWKMSNEEELETFSFFDRAIVEFIKANFNTYDLIHCNDWHTGLVTHLLQDELAASRPATLFTVHNLMYQGIGPREIVRNVGIVPGQHSLIDWDISDGDLNMVQQAVASSDFVNAVSPTYAKEILTPEFGLELADILLAREARVSGILNGIDYTSFPRNYTPNAVVEGKRQAKRTLLARLGLSADSDRPLYSFVGRLDPNQKGLDILYESLPFLIEKGGIFVLLGSGDAKWQKKFAELGQIPELKDNFSAQLVFDLELATQIYSGSDYIIVPSKYEPCGLIQMIAMWYGTVPIVRATGGLKDSVFEGENGFVFEKYNAASLQEALSRSLESYKSGDFVRLSRNAIAADFSWKNSALEYKKLYEKVIKLRLESL